jgi:hypothetical protein
MAALTAAQVLQVWAEGRSDRAALYALRNVTAGDTADLSADFSVVKQAIMLGTTVNGAGVATASGTAVTMPAGLSKDAAYLLA